MARIDVLKARENEKTLFDWRNPPLAECWGCYAPLKMKAALHVVQTPDGEHCAEPVPTYCAECGAKR